MVAVQELSWEEISSPNFGNPTKAAWRQAVADIAARAKETLPECTGRVDSAVKIVLAGDVELLEGGTAKVASQSHGTTVYHVVNGECTCKDFPKAPSGWCKHRIAAGLAKRVAQRVSVHGVTPTTTAAQAERSAAYTTPEPSQTPEATTGQPGASNALANLPLPEAPVSITLKATLHGHEVLVTLRGTDFASVKVQVEAASQWLQAQGSPAAAADPAPQCPIHHVPMKQQTNTKGTWYSHKTLNGWCKGR